MKYTGVLLVFVLFVSLTASAQEIAANSSLMATGSVAASLPPAFASATLASDLPSSGFPSAAGVALPQVGVQSVFPSYSWQAYAGYTFVRVYAFPSREVNRNGFDIGMSYYFHSGHFGAEGALTTTFGSISGERSDFVFAGGGPRFRWSAPRGIEVWGHGLVGGANFGPTIAGFGQGALAYELGAGVDINAHRQRFSYRLEADMISTRLYHLTQYSPKFSVGIVYKF
jgi:hypothetical protein